ncbi:MAG: hypothetical protein ACLTMP_11110 [Eggerthella lenta]
MVVPLVPSRCRTAPRLRRRQLRPAASRLRVNAAVVGIAFDEQRVETVPCEPTSPAR